MAGRNGSNRAGEGVGATAAIAISLALACAACCLPRRAAAAGAVAGGKTAEGRDRGGRQRPSGAQELVGDVLLQIALGPRVLDGRTGLHVLGMEGRGDLWLRVAVGHRFAREWAFYLDVDLFWGFYGGPASSGGSRDTLLRCMAGAALERRLAPGLTARVSLKLQIARWAVFWKPASGEAAHPLGGLGLAVTWRPWRQGRLRPFLELGADVGLRRDSDPSLGGAYSVGLGAGIGLLVGVEAAL